METKKRKGIRFGDGFRPFSELGKQRRAREGRRPADPADDDGPATLAELRREFSEGRARYYFTRGYSLDAARHEERQRARRAPMLTMSRPAAVTPFVIAR